MNTHGCSRVAMALTLLLVVAMPSQADFTFTTHVTLNNPAPNTRVRFDCWLAMNGDMELKFLGSEWASASGEVTIAMPGSPTVLVADDCLLEVLATDEFGQVRRYCWTDLVWEVEVLTTGSHQDIYLRATLPPAPDRPQVGQ